MVRHAREDLPESVRASNREDSSERAYSAADRAQRFLSLTAVISLLLSAVAVAMSAALFDGGEKCGPEANMAKLLASDGADGDSFGVSVALDGDTALIGADQIGRATSRERG